MTSSELIETVATAAYRRGEHPLTVGLAVAEIVIEETLGVPCGDPGVSLLARRVTGALLDAGWQMPSRTEPP
jgi:hypothetical protein